MADADVILERRRLRRRLTGWRVFAFLALAAAIAALWFALGGDRGLLPFGKEVARVRIDGTITVDRPLLQLLDELAKNDNVAAVMLSIDSGGGTTAGGEAIYNAVRRLSDKKPVVATVDTMAASAAYLIAIAADRVFVRRTSITGSIGVIFEMPKVTALMDRVGISVETVKSAPLKAEPSPWRPSVPGSLDVITDVVDEAYDWFVDIVAERRGVEPEFLRSAGGRIWGGEKAVELKLADAIGGEEEARAWLAEEKDVPEDIPLVTREPRESGEGLFPFLIRQGAKSLGIPNLLPPGLSLDGLLSVWQAPAASSRDSAQGADR